MSLYWEDFTVAARYPTYGRTVTEENRSIMSGTTTRDDRQIQETRAFLASAFSR